MNNMTPQEKALDLYNRMIVDFTIDKWQSKQCALIVVDELEKQEATLLNYNSESYSSEYWQEVKQEIKKI